MGKLSYVIKRARKMDYRAMLKTADMLHKKDGQEPHLADGRYGQECAAKYNAGYVDYKIAEMYQQTTRSAPRRSRAAFPTTSSRG